MINEKSMRWSIKITSVIVGLLILFIVATTATDPYEMATLNDLKALRGAAMLGFMGWLFTYVSTLRPRVVKTRPKEDHV